MTTHQPTNGNKKKKILISTIPMMINESTAEKIDGINPSTTLKEKKEKKK